MAVTVEPVFPPQVLTWEELPLLTVEAELPHWEGRRAFCRYYAAWGRGLLDYGRRVLLPQLAERCRRALEQGGMLPLTTAARDRGRTAAGAMCGRRDCRWGWGSASRPIRRGTAVCGRRRKSGGWSCTPAISGWGKRDCSCRGAVPAGDTRWCVCPTTRSWGRWIHLGRDGLATTT